MQLQKSGYFNPDSLTMDFGGSLSLPHNMFTAKALKLPVFESKHKDGDGDIFYSVEEHWYAIYREGNEVIGYISFGPYSCEKRKINLRGIPETKHCHAERIFDFIETNLD